MFVTHLRTAFRNILRHKWLSLINIAGLGVGSACSLLILSDIQYELSYDRFHSDSAHIYRCLVQSSHPIELTPAPLAEEMRRHFPEVLAATRIGDDQSLVKFGDKSLDEKRILWADTSFLSVFTFPAVQGDPRLALAKPHSVVLTESTAKRLFGADNPIGKVIIARDIINLEVGAVLKDPPENSHLQFDYIISLSTHKAVWNDEVGCGSTMLSVSAAESKKATPLPWYTLAGKTYFKLASGTDPEAFQQRLNERVSSLSTQGKAFKLAVQAITDIHLNGQDTRQTPGLTNDRNYVYLISGLALIVLLIACINYVNLTTARAATRSKEVGIRKVLGGRRSTLIAQFLTESLVVTVVAVVVSLALAEFAFPTFKALAHAPLSLNLLESRYLQCGLVGLVVFIGVAAGVYPAIVLSKGSPQSAIYRRFASGTGKTSLLRKGLVLCQNALAVALIFCTVVVIRQLNYVRTRDQGLDTGRVVLFPMKDHRTTGGLDDLKRRIAQRPDVVDVSFSDAFLYKGCYGSSACVWDGMTPDNASVSVDCASVGVNFTEFYDIKLVEGRGLSQESPNDYLLNETAVKELGWETAVGRRFGVTSVDVGTVVGVVKDFNYSPLHNQVGPLALRVAPTDNWGELAVRFRDDDPSETLSYIKSIWPEYSAYPFAYEYLEQRMQSAYATEQRLVRILAWSAGIAIWIACLGLLGLASFEVERRTRETAVRRVFGATAPVIAASFSVDFLKWVLIANVLAAPVSMYFMNRWLQSFAYRINIGIGTFLVVGLMALSVSLLAIVFQTVRAATTNPVDALRCE